MKLFRISLIFVMILLMCSCSMKQATKETAYEKINKKYIDISDYIAKGTLTMHGNKTSNTYNFTQYYKKDNRYLLNYEDDIGIVFDNNKVVIKNNELNSKVEFDSDSKEYIYFFINSFFKKYFNDEDVSITTNSPINEKYIILECETDGVKFKKQKLWIDIKSVLPSKMEIYDDKENVLAILNFTDFKFDKNIDDNLFVLN